MLCGSILVRNIFEFYTPEQVQPLLPMPVNLVVIIIVVFGLSVVATLAFLSGYNESKLAATAGLVVLGFTLLFWIAVSFLSLFVLSSAGKPNVCCVHARCPETLWLVGLRPSRYDTSSVSRTHRQEPVTTSRPHTTTEPPLELLAYYNPYFYPEKVPLINGTRYFYVPFLRDRSGNIKTQRLTSSDSRKRGRRSPEYEDKGNDSIFTFPVFVSLIIFVALIVLFLFFACIIWSWTKEVGKIYKEEEDIRLRN